jgi:hypothetical protein
MSKTRAELKAELLALEEQKYCLAMSDDFCYTNGNMDALNTLIRETKRLLAAYPETPDEKKGKSNVD